MAHSMYYGLEWKGVRIDSQSYCRPQKYFGENVKPYKIFHLIYKDKGGCKLSYNTNAVTCVLEKFNYNV